MFNWLTSLFKKKKPSLTGGADSISSSNLPLKPPSSFHIFKKEKIETGFLGVKDLEPNFYLWTPFEIRGNQYEVFNNAQRERLTLPELIYKFNPCYVYLCDEPVFFKIRSLVYRKDPTIEPPFESTY